MIVKILFRAIRVFLGILCTIITLLQFFVGTDTYARLQEKYGLPTSIPIFFKIIFVCGLLVVIFICILRKYISDSKKRALTTDKLHQFHHLVRDLLFVLKRNIGHYNLSSHRLYYEFVKDKSYFFCERICEFLKLKYNKDFSVCIKMIDGDGENTTDVNVYTLCRAGVAKESRSRYDNTHNEANQNEDHVFIRVSENSDFESLLSNSEENETTSVFACSNLVMLNILSKIFPIVYKNSTPNFLKYYKSTVVVPIRIERKYIKSSPNAYDMHPIS